MHKSIKTIDRARREMLDLVPPGASLFTSANWHDSRDPTGWRQSVCYTAAVYQGSTEIVRLTAATPGDLYRNFAFRMVQILRPKRIADEPETPVAARAVVNNGRARLVDVHDGVRATKRIAAVPTKRINGPQ